MTGSEHYRAAERLAEQAGGWMDADTGWKASLSTEERLARRAADLAEAQVHATLALAPQAYPGELDSTKDLSRGDAGRLLGMLRGFAGRADLVALTAAELRIVLDALADAESHRMREAAEFCGDCEAHPSGACEQHLDHVAAAQEYHDLAAELESGAE